MSLSELPLWLVLAVGIFAILGALLTLVGTIGLVRLNNFYERVHAPTLGTSLGSGFILLASILYFSVTAQRPSVHARRFTGTVWKAPMPGSTRTLISSPKSLALKFGKYAS